MNQDPISLRSGINQYNDPFVSTNDGDQLGLTRRVGLALNTLGMLESGAGMIVASALSNAPEQTAITKKGGLVVLSKSTYAWGRLGMASPGHGVIMIATIFLRSTHLMIKFFGLIIGLIFIILSPLPIFSKGLSGAVNALIFFALGYLFIRNYFRK